MCIYNELEKILLLILIPILASCSGGDKGTSPSLNADDIWDQMAAERKKPLPVNSQSDDSGEILSDLPLAISPATLSSKDIEAYRTTLLAADEKYQSIKTILDAPLQVAETEVDRQAQLRTKQLHMSRLINLQNNMEQAINAISNVDQTLANRSRELLAVIAEYIIRSRSRLADNN